MGCIVVILSLPNLKGLRVSNCRNLSPKMDSGRFARETADVLSRNVPQTGSEKKEPYFRRLALDKISYFHKVNLVVYE